MLWLKALHLITMVTWFAGLFYLPRLFVYHTQVRDEDNNARFKIMERKLFWAITTPGGVLTLVLGSAMIFQYGMDWFRVQGWLHAKLALLLLLCGFHVWCGLLMKQLARDQRRSEKFYRMINEIPVLPLIGVILLAVLRPF